LNVDTSNIKISSSDGSLQLYYGNETIFDFSSGALSIKGNINSGSIITGATLSGGSININDKFIVDA